MQHDLTQTPLWGFAERLWSDKSVQSTLLFLQNTHGCRVNLLLYACWAGSHQEMIAREVCGETTSNHDWHLHTVTKLRALRMRSSYLTDAKPLYREVLETEIMAERIELGMLYVEHLKRAVNYQAPHLCEAECLIRNITLVLPSNTLSLIGSEIRSIAHFCLGNTKLNEIDSALSRSLAL